MSSRGAIYSSASSHYIDADQYAYLADALLHGRFWLDLPVPEAFSQLPDPYDYEARFEVSHGGENPIFWDYAFFEGKYYCYFGVIPAVLLYVPYQMITGEMLNTSIAVCILGEAFVIAACMLVYRIGRIFFEDKGSFVILTLAAFMLVGGSNVVYLGFVSRFYSVPILASLAFTCLGLWFWLGAKFLQVRYMGSKSTNNVRISVWRLAAGSIFMTLNIGCRPQFMLSCLLAVPLFWDEIVHKRMLFSRDSLGLSIAASLPFIVGIGMQCAYNYLRFGSLLDFGSAYNLNSFEMGSYDQKPITTLVVAFWFLFQPLHIEAYFPFVYRTSYMWPVDIALSNPVVFLAYMLPLVFLLAYVVRMWVRAIRSESGRPFLHRFATISLIASALVLLFIFVGYARDVISLGGGMRGIIGAIGIATVEPMFGGYFWLCPMGLLVFTLPLVKPTLKEHKVYALSVVMLVLAAIVLLFDARTVGANQRYFGDFAWYLMLVSILCLFAWDTKQKAKRLSVPLSAFAVLLSILIGACSLFSNERYDSISELNPELYDAVASAFPEQPDGETGLSSNEAVDSILKPEE